MTRDEAEGNCSSIRKFNAQWRLPKLNTTKKNGQMVTALQHPSYRRNLTLFWIGLRRDTILDENEASDLSRWADASKWRWTDDQTTLEDSVDENWERGQPDNAHYFEQTPAGIDDMESCVVAMLRRRAERSSFAWEDLLCNGEQIGSDIDGLLLVCETDAEEATTDSETSTDLVTTEFTITPIDPDEEVESAKPETKEAKSFQWQWLLLALGIVVLLACAIILVVVYVRRRHWRAQKTGMTTTAAKTAVQDRRYMNVSKASQADRRYMNVSSTSQSTLGQSMGESVGVSTFFHSGISVSKTARPMLKKKQSAPSGAWWKRR